MPSLSYNILLSTSFDPPLLFRPEIKDRRKKRAGSVFPSQIDRAFRTWIGGAGKASKKERKGEQDQIEGANEGWDKGWTKKKKRQRTGRRRID